MKAPESPATTADGDIEITSPLVELLPPQHEDSVLVPMPESTLYDTDLTPEEEDEGWAKNRFSLNTMKPMRSMMKSIKTGTARAAL